jgi:hypothetical protein
MRETRSFVGDFRQSDGNKLVGYAAVWDSPTQINNEGGRSFTEVIRSGAFSKAIASRGDVIATFNHNPDALLARTSNGTLRLNEDSRGLRFELDLPDTQLGRDIRALTSAGTLNGASFTFNVRTGGDRWDGNTREVTDVYLYELGPVSMPAYEATSVGLRSQWINDKRRELLMRL